MVSEKVINSIIEVLGQVSENMESHLNKTAEIAEIIKELKAENDHLRREQMNMRSEIQHLYAIFGHGIQSIRQTDLPS